MYNLEWLLKKYDEGQALKFLYFWGHTPKNNQEPGKFYLSQWFTSPFEVDDTHYATAEHWMMACKAKLFQDEDMFSKIIQAKSPGTAKLLGRKVNNFEHTTWLQHRFDIVVLGNIHKFNQNQKMGHYLLQTDTRVLVEASPNDVIWGIGLDENAPSIHNPHSWKGTNLLGFALMVARDYLKNEGFFNPSESPLNLPILNLNK